MTLQDVSQLKAAAAQSLGKVQLLSDQSEQEFRFIALILSQPEITGVPTASVFLDLNNLLHPDFSHSRLIVPWCPCLQLRS